MAVIEVSPFVLKDILLTLATTGASPTSGDYQKHVSAAAFTPKADVKTWTGLGANTVTDVGTATWTCDLTYAQDWETTASLSQFLMDHEGEKIDAIMEPITGEGSKFTATLTVTPGAIGGKGGDFLEATVSLGSTKPVKTAVV